LPGPGSASLRIAATEVAPGADLDAWVTAHAGTLTPYGFLESAERTCRIPVGGSTTMIPAGPGAFETQLVAGHPARVRAQCGYVAAVVLVKDLMYAMSFYTGVSPSADLDLFDRFASTLVFDAVAPRAPTGFVSPLYDYALQVPAGWEAQAATASWPGTGPTAEAPVADVFESPGTKPGARSAHRFSVVAMEVSPGLDAQAWARKHIALPPEVEEMGAPGHRHCRFGGMMVDEPIGDWYATRIGGHPAFAREVCRTVDAVVVVGDHLYQMRHRGPRPHEFTPGQWTPFKVIADSMTFSRP
jgi:hypothetical protein